MASEVRAKALEVHGRQLDAYGEPPPPANRDPLDALVLTILSQNTNDRLRDVAFRRLRAAFPSWEEVRDAPVEAIGQAIQVAGLWKQKAARIKEALQRITAERGTLTLDFLRELPTEEARRYLLSFNGVGPKTAAIILLFTLGMPAFPVDTHVHRVTRRLGLIPDGTGREKAHELLEAILPPETYYAFHINVIRHGRAVCAARRPRCAECPLRDVCDYCARTCALAPGGETP
ncbi:MAG: endonuclease III domain-containing protein [Anaerolineae bacterium]